MRISTRLSPLLFVTALLVSTSAFAQTTASDFDEEHAHSHGDPHGDSEDIENLLPLADIFSCARASKQNLVAVNQGNQKADRFLDACAAATNNSSWCAQLVRPNPSSRATFSCTYGSSQPHRLIHPDESTWAYAFRAVKLVDELEAKGISVDQIYNWWRPEPYNKNVGGAAGRHPYGTSIDVRFSSMNDMENAHKQLCRWRSQGRLRAVGYYGSTGLHIGVGDKTANTWGKSCS